MECPHIKDIRPPSGTVYRDECCTCCHSQDSTHGIDVCLGCYQAGCIERGHGQAHNSLTSHPVVLNIKRTKRKRKDVEKLEIAAETDADRYDYQTKTRCISCQTDVELPAIVDKVMNSMTSAQQAEVKAWQQEMTACDHVLLLQQETPRAVGTTCSKCELKENLWLCLVCGTLSCGRPQFGGGGGNGHGLEHVSSTGHSVAVKLGSITPEGADIYCYACDEERLDPMLEEHLAHWQITLAGREKTEKSLQELQLEQNLKWEFSMSVDGKEMTPISGPGFTGMRNIGNTCYIASILQSLFTFKQIQERFYQPLEVSIDPAQSLETQMRKIADGILSGDFEDIAPSMLKSLVGRGHAEFSTMRQQDAYEFFLYLTDKLSSIYKFPEFKFLTEQRMQCKSCKRVAYTTSENEGVSVLVPAKKIGDDYAPVKVSELVASFCAVEDVEYTCSCGAKDGATRQTLFKTFPEILVLNPGRFSLVNWVPQKLEIPLIIDDLNLEAYLTKGQQADEVLMEESASPEVDQLMQMGFPQARAQAALSVTSSLESAMEWLFSHMDDPDITDDLVDMGFPRDRAVQAAAKYSDLGEAMEWLTAEPAENDVIDTKAADYAVRAMVCHKGTSVHAGHYVAYCHKDEWTLFNDEKVLRGCDSEEASRTAYVYFFDRSS